MRMHMKATRGFSLIELLIVITIVSILAAIAIPSYRDYIVRTNRGAARACLSEAAQFMERWYTSNMTYELEEDDLVLNCEQEGGLDNHYVFSVGEPEQRTYTLTATPQGAQASDDTKCGTLSLTETGARGATGTGGADACWK